MTPESLTQIAPLLGTVPDRILAKRFGCRSSTIFHIRRRKGIPALYEKQAEIHWTDNQIRQFGTTTDAELAACWGMAAGTVSRARAIRDIPSYRGQKPHLPHIPVQARRLLGKLSDEELARRFRISIYAISFNRKRLDIPPMLPIPRVNWTEEMLVDLRALKPNQFRRRYSISDKTLIDKRCECGIPPLHVRFLPIRWTKPMLRDLAVLSSSAFARRYGIEKTTVSNKRRQLGIPPHIWEKRYRPEEDKLLGSMPDDELAKHISRSAGSITQRRVHLGIPAAARNPFTPAEDALIGTMSDRRLALKLKRTVCSIEARRRHLNLPSFQDRHLPRFTRLEDRLLGTMTDMQLAKRINRDVRCVTQRRDRLGIPSYREATFRPFTSAEDALIGTMIDKDLAKKLRRTLCSVQARRRTLGLPSFRDSYAPAYTPDEDRLLGTMSDEDVAKRTRHTVKGITMRRRRLGIPCYRDFTQRHLTHANVRWTEASDALLGTRPDAEIAVMLDIVPKVVARRRNRLNILEYRGVP